MDGKEKCRYLRSVRHSVVYDNNMDIKDMSFVNIDRYEYAVWPITHLLIKKSLHKHEKCDIMV